VIPLNVNPNNVDISENRGFNSAIHDHIYWLGVNHKFDSGAITGIEIAPRGPAQAGFGRVKSRGAGARARRQKPRFSGLNALTSLPCADKTRALYGRR